MVKLENLTDFEVLMLASQQQINAKLNHIIEAMELPDYEGFNHETRGILNGFEMPRSGYYRSEWLSKTQKDECLLILDIYCGLYNLTRREDAPENLKEMSSFPGFYHNDRIELGYLRYAKWLFEDGRYDLLDPINKVHSPKLPRYKVLIHDLKSAGFEIINDYAIIFPKDPKKEDYEKLLKIFGN